MSTNLRTQATPEPRIPLLDLRREHAAIAGELRLAWDEVLANMRLLGGPNVAAFEAEIAAFTGTTHAVGVASGTDALLLALLALEVGPGDEVFLHPNAFAACVEAVHHAGAVPRLVDVAADGPGPDPDQLGAAITPRTRAVIAVHLYGAPLNLGPILSIADRRGVTLIEDGSHAHGAARDGRRVGSFGRIGCFSAGVVKNLAAYGDAGYVTTSDAVAAGRLRLLQKHGQRSKNEHVLYGSNSRLDELQAAVLRVKLRHLERRNRRRARIAAHYRARFAGLPVRVPIEPPGEVHVYHQFVIRAAERDRLRAHLECCGIESGIHYPVPLHRQPAWQQRYGDGPPLPRAEALAREILSIPVWPDLTDAEVERIADAVAGFFASGR